jgi:hypothetical protein
MQLSTRYGLVGIGALVLLTTVGWLREKAMSSGPISEYLLGVLPNFAAAIAITFVPLSVWTDQKREATPSSIKRAFTVCGSISAVGLIAWEAIQTTNNRFVFDVNDLGATLVGVMVAGLLFFSVTPRGR